MNVLVVHNKDFMSQEQIFSKLKFLKSSKDLDGNKPLYEVHSVSLSMAKASELDIEDVKTLYFDQSTIKPKDIFPYIVKFPNASIVWINFSDEPMKNFTLSVSKKGH